MKFVLKLTLALAPFLVPVAAHGADLYQRVAALEGQVAFLMGRVAGGAPAPATTWACESKGFGRKAIRETGPTESSARSAAHAACNQLSFDMDKRECIDKIKCHQEH